MQKLVIGILACAIIAFFVYRNSGENPGKTNSKQSAQKKLPKGPGDESGDFDDGEPEAVLKQTITPANAEQITQAAGQLPEGWPQKYSVALNKLYDEMIAKCKDITGSDKLNELEDCALVERNKLFQTKPMTVKEFILAYTE